MIDTPRRILVIAGSDSSGGAGIQADIAAIRALGAFPLCAVSCITSQSAKGLRMLSPCDTDIFADQIFAAFEDFRPDAVKIGMVPSEKHLRIILDIFSVLKPMNIVIDPIMAPTLGNKSLCREMWRNKDIVKEFANHTALLTPNRPEALRMIANYGTSKHISSNEDILLALRDNLLCTNILLKGGHMEGEVLTDTLLTEDGFRHFTHKKISTANTHGTGCTLSSAIAASLPGSDINHACEKGIRYLEKALRDGKDCSWYDSTQGHGPSQIII